MAGTMALDQGDLLAGEVLLQSKFANAVIALSDYGLERLPFDQLLQVTGFAGKEAIGGTLHLTNYRLLFTSHQLNRLTGRFSIFLPTILQLRDASGLFSKKLEVRTQTQSFVFVVWGVPALIRAITAAGAQLAPAQVAEMRALALARSGQATEGLALSGYGDQLLQNLPEMMKMVFTLSQNPLDVSSMLNLIELVAPRPETA